MIKTVSVILLVVLVLPIGAGWWDRDNCCDDGCCDNFLQCKCSGLWSWGISHQPPRETAATAADLTLLVDFAPPSDIYLGQLDRPPRLFS